MIGRENIAKIDTETTRNTKTKTDTERTKIGTEETETSIEKTETGTGKGITRNGMKGREGSAGTGSTSQREEMIIAQKTQAKEREAVTLHMTHQVTKQVTTCQP